MGSSAAVVLVDNLLRRLALPLVLIASVIFRYNVLSLVYLLLFIVSLLLPGPRLKSQRASNLVYLSLLLVWSGLAAVGQTLFQIVLATDYSDELEPCSQQENIWRQFGFILYKGAGVSGVDVVRHLLPDCVVFLTALASLVVNARVVAGLGRRRQGGAGEEGAGGQGAGGQREEEAARGGGQEATGDGSDSELPDVTSGSRDEPLFPSNVQCYWRMPSLTVLIFDVCIFITLGLAGIAVPSLTSFTYYAVFLAVLAIWSFHLSARLRGVVRVLRCLLAFYTMLHLTLLYLYQFQAAQQNIPLLPDNTYKSLLARLFGLTAIIRTDCEHPTELLLHSDLYYPVFFNPGLLLLLCWLLTSDLRLWMGTPSPLWREHGTYYMPVGDFPPSSRVVCLVYSGRAASPDQWTQYGTYRIRGNAGQVSQATGVDGGSGEERGSVGYVEYQEGGQEGGATGGGGGYEGEAVDVVPQRTRKRRVTWQDVKDRVAQGATTVWVLLLNISYIPAIICMMLWSVLYPSWPALLLLLWACVIWLIPKFTPRDSLFYTSPMLILYSVCLLLLQYVFSLDLTLAELTPPDGLSRECYLNTTPGCKSFVPLIKTAFTVVFFCAFHEFVRLMQEKHRQRQSNSTDDIEEDVDEATPTSVAQRLRSEVFKSASAVFSGYWVLLVVAAFLLVTLSGEPNLFKTIYLVFFFVFLITYQVSRGCWYYVCVPVWWGLVLYAALELVLIYTYQFDVISDAWDRAYNNTPHLRVDSEDLFHSIGLRKYGITSLRSLLISLVPPAIFIAVMAMQLRYFAPTWSSRAAPDVSSLDLSSLLPATLRSSFSQPHPTRDSVMVVDMPGGDKQTEGTEDTEAHSRPLSRSSSVASSVMPGTPLYHCYRVTSYLLLKTKQIVLQLVLLCWRFLELHLHKIAMLILFVVSMSEVSAGYWVLLAVSLLAIPLPYFSPLLYPLLTLYLGLLVTLKTIYQFPIVSTNSFNLTDFNSSDKPDEQCYEPLNTTTYLGNYSGKVFDYRYSSRAGDGGWFGLHKVSNYTEYIAGPIFVALLLSLRFSAKRHQAEYYRSKNIVIDVWEQGSLFLGVSQHKAERSVLAACKYLVNHIFEMYGIEITVAMLAITVAVRIDLYGIFYCAVLGVLLLLPRRVMALVWLLYTPLHGLLLMLQYSMLLGVPQGVCFYPGGSRDYPWADIASHTDTNFGLKKWFFLSDYPQMLDKSLLYVDFLVYLLLCMQLYNFRHLRELNKPLSDFLKTESLINSIKIFMTKYYFWVSLFLVFFAAISRVSLFGLLYLLLCFVLLYRGQNMLMDRQSNRTRSWAVFRLLAWGILLIRVSVQIADCVFYGDLRRKTQCNLILVFNGGCNRQSFYGSPEPNCSSYPGNVGLWVDALTFVVITLQIVIFDTQYSEMMREYLIERNKKAGDFSDVFEAKMEERQHNAKEARDREFAELKERSERLSVTENTIDHILHAGVRIPPDISLRPRHKSVEADSTRGEDFDTLSLELSDSVDLPDEEPKSKLGAGRSDSRDSSAVAEEASKLSRFWKFISAAVLEFVDSAIEWLEKSSSLYVEIVEELKEQGEGEKEGEVRQEETEALKSDREVAGPSTKYGSVQQVQVEVHAEERRSVDSYTVATSGEHSLVEPTSSIQQSPPASTLQPPTTETDVPLRTKKSVRFAEEPNSVYRTVSTEDEGRIADFEDEFSKVAEKYSKRPVRFMKALQNSLMAHAEYVIYFLVILNVILNGSVLSLGYACLLFAWGLLCIPWPSKTFWLAMIFYSMLVLVTKYAFQFHDIEVFDDREQSGLYPPNVLGIQYYPSSVDFFANATWDMLLLIALLLNRGLLKQTGLWRYYQNNQVNIFTRAWNGVKEFFSQLLNPDISQGAADYYVIMLFFDILCLVTIVFGVSSFGVGVADGAGGGVVQTATLIQSNYVPLPFVAMLLLQFLSMLVDRAIYLRHALKTKFAFQMFLLVVWHFWLLFILPSEVVTKTPFTKNVAAQCIYFFKSVYFVVSAFQIISGYPTRILGYFLGRRYTTVSGLLFMGYRVIPLLPELREVMDWVFTDTTLSLFHWLRVQEIYAKLYLVKVRRHREKGSPRDLGQEQSLLIKALLGGLLLVLLVLLIWGPLLVISLINSTNVANRPVATTISLTLDGYEPLVQITVQRESLMSLNNSEYAALRDSLESKVQPLFGNQIFQEDFTKAIFPSESTSLWTISPPAKSLLLQRLDSVKRSNASNAAITLQFSWSIQREPSSSSAAEVVSGLNSRSLSYKSDPSTVDALIKTLTFNGSQEEVLLLNLYPKLIYAPDTGQSNNYTDLSRYYKNSPNISCHTNLSSSENSIQEWWTLAECTDPIHSKVTGPPILLIYSRRITSQVFNIIAGFGIIGLYLSVVLVISRLIRNAISSLPSELLLDEIVNPNPLLKLCNDIFTVRESKDFKLEEILVGKLFSILRSPERLIELTENAAKKKQD